MTKPQYDVFWRKVRDYPFVQRHCLMDCCTPKLENFISAISRWTADNNSSVMVLEENLIC